FAVWLDRHEFDHDPDDIAWFVEYWTQYAAPGSQRCIAPERLAERRRDGFFWHWPDDTLNKVLALLPAWTRYCADHDGLPRRLTEQAIAALPVTIDDLEIPEYHRGWSHLNLGPLLPDHTPKPMARSRCEAVRVPTGLLRCTTPSRPPTD